MKATYTKLRESKGKATQVFPGRKSSAQVCLRSLCQPVAQIDTDFKAGGSPLAHVPKIFKKRKMSEIFKVPAPVGEKRRMKRSLSPQPSTSKAPIPPAPLPLSSPLFESAAVLPADAQDSNPVYEHVDKNLFCLNQIGQLKGLKTNRRRGRWCRMHRMNQGQNINIHSILSPQDDEGLVSLESLVHKEIKKQQDLQLLIASGLSHFARTVTGIVDKFEGKETGEWTLKPEAIKKSVDKYANLFDKNDSAEESETQFEGPEDIRRLREETQAAVEALLTGDRTKEYVSERYTFIVEAFKAIAASKAIDVSTNT